MLVHDRRGFSIWRPLVRAGTTVTFVNLAGNTKDHCARYFYNDCAGFPWNTGEIVVR